MKLSTLDRFEEIVIQMHNNPDADTIGAGYAMYCYFKDKGKKVRLIYGGTRKITKSNIVLLVQELKIPIEYVRTLNYAPELLLIVDGQYREGNVEYFDAKQVAMIDHHNTGRLSDEWSEIRSHLVSCSTVVYDMLKKEGYDVNKDKSVATALYYGLFMDSNHLSEIRHPLERDMMDFLVYDKVLLKRLCYANFTLQELETAGIAMLRYNYDSNRRYTIIKSKPCDPNILGVIGDIVLQVDSVDVSIIYHECEEGYRLSIRSCVVEVAANDLAAYLTRNIGNGGGHNDKAGGFISQTAFEEKYGTLGIDTYFFDAVTEYYESFKVIKASVGLPDYEGFSLYKKRDLAYGYVKSMDLFPEGTPCKIRTLEGDVFITVAENIYIMVGVTGEVYPIEKTKFDRKYRTDDTPFVKEFEYEPSIIDLTENTSHSLLPHIRECHCSDSARIYAKQLDYCAKVFTKWDYETYMLGKPKDYICYPDGDVTDIYIIQRGLFDILYEKAE